MDGFFGKSDPFLRFLRIHSTGEKRLSHEGETVMDNLNPIWKPFEIGLAKLSYADINNRFCVECWDW
jgi:hypothetical protein